MHVKITLFTLVLLVACVWIRRRSFRVPWYRAVTVSVILQAVAFVLITPELAVRTGAGPWLPASAVCRTCVTIWASWRFLPPWSL